MQPTVPKHELKNTVKIPSLKNIALEISKPTVKEDTILENVAVEQNEFTFDALNTLWATYLKTFKEKGKSSECLILDRPIQLSDRKSVV